MSSEDPSYKLDQDEHYSPSDPIPPSLSDSNWACCLHACTVCNCPTWRSGWVWSSSLCEWLAEYYCVKDACLFYADLSGEGVDAPREAPAFPVRLPATPAYDLTLFR